MKSIKMRYSIEPGDRIYVKGYGFFSFAKNMSKSISNKYSIYQMHKQNKQHRNRYCSRYWYCNADVQNNWI